jgi:hypothetical protein
MTDKSDRKRWVWTAALAAVLTPSLYMGAYYATISTDYSDCLPFYAYKIGGNELPSWSQDFFAAANWIDDRMHLAPCKRPPSIPIR